ncbi:MAG: ABC transporter permease subunit [Acidimicrobiales bacterium]
MSLPVTARNLAGHRRPLVWWVVGLVSYAAMILAVYPSLRNQPGMAEIAKSYPKALLALFGMDAASFDLAQASTFLNTYLFSAIVPLLYVIFGASRGAAAVAGQEETGVLDLVLAYPVRRRSYVLQAALAVLVELVVIGFVLWLTVVVGGRLVGLDVDVARLSVASLALVLLGGSAAGLALAVGCATGGKGLADGVAAGVGVASYLVASLAGIASWLEPARYASAFWYATDGAMTRGVPLGHLAALVLVDLVLVAAAVVLFERRDLAG